MKKKLFSLNGRINRAKYWGYAIVALAILIIGSVLGTLLANVSQELSSVVFIVTIFTYLWITVTLQVKRWHDLDRSGWMSLLNFIPVLNIVVFVVLGFFKGTQGSNKYGEDLLSYETNINN